MPSSIRVPAGMSVSFYSIILLHSLWYTRALELQLHFPLTQYCKIGKFILKTFVMCYSAALQQNYYALECTL